MCGICGYCGASEISQAALRVMNDTMYHRGPDDHGEVVFSCGEQFVGMAQRRLSILDLSAAGHQPMDSHDGMVTVVFNGEIYNFFALREELKKYPFQSKTDTEVILAGYLKWGEDVFSHLSGMFAIALFDRNSQRMLLARDRVGKKPLYYSDQDGTFVFGSELKPILKCPGFSREIRQEVLGRYLFYGYIPAPDTIFQNVYKLEPGHYLNVSKAGVQNKVYWDAISVYQAQQKQQIVQYEDAKEQLMTLLKSAVSRRMVADVPVGTLLSGGIDSTVVTALAQQTQSGRVKTFSIGFEQAELDEAPFARQVAQYLGTEHTDCVITEAEMSALMDDYAYYFDEPMADPAAIPTMLVSRMARQKVTVALSGDGGDELFCGYGRYDFARQAQKLNFAGAMLHAAGTAPLIRALDPLSKLPIGLQELAKNRNEETKAQWGGEYLIEQIQTILKQKQIAVKFPIETMLQTNDYQKRLMMVDFLTLLPEMFLSKVDRASMKYSLEARCPILDERVVELSFRIPHSFKYHRGEKKHILKDIAYELVPKEILDRPKRGFSVPTDAWLRGHLRERLTDVSQKDYLKKQDIFDVDTTHKMIGRYLDGESQYSTLVWYFYVFQCWYENDQKGLER